MRVLAACFALGLVACGHESSRPPEPTPWVTEWTVESGPSPASSGGRVDALEVEAGADGTRVRFRHCDYRGERCVVGEVGTVHSGELIDVLGGTREDAGPEHPCRPIVLRRAGKRVASVCGAAPEFARAAARAAMPLGRPGSPPRSWTFMTQELDASVRAYWVLDDGDPRVVRVRCTDPGCHGAMVWQRSLPDYELEHTLRWFAILRAQVADGVAHQEARPGGDYVKLLERDGGVGVNREALKPQDADVYPQAPTDGFGWLLKYGSEE